ncbi:MAG: class I tRNA ligase family protein [Planctomycetota bacterium]
MSEIPIHYDPAATEGPMYKRWLEAGAFAADPSREGPRYVIMMPLPNVTGALHIGHAMDNGMQDLLIRWHRMKGEDVLWMPGTDHAGIATQAIIEKRLFELEGKTRHDLGREGLVALIWKWKEQYQKRIIEQLQRLGCSCDWGLTRFTMDAVCSRAVRRTFFTMFHDGLIYQGHRLVNWDCSLQTAIADDEIVYEPVGGHFWYMKYPVIDPKPGEPAHVIVATTRPETMFGDTAVACHPDPRGELEALLQKTREDLATAHAREKAELETSLQDLETRMTTHLPELLTLAEMARDGRKVMLPILDRPIPLIVDPWAKPELGSGCVKITPAHDVNDYEVWERHRDEIEIINILNPDGTLNANAGPCAGLDRFEARDKTVEKLEALDLIDAVEDRPVEVGHSDRSKSPVEPYLSRQWFVHMKDVEGGIVCGRGTKKEITCPGLAQAAIDAAEGQWRSPTEKTLVFHPDQERYSKTYLNWLKEKRDWCISRQLWWGHSIPVWSRTAPPEDIEEALRAAGPWIAREDTCVRMGRGEGLTRIVESGAAPPEGEGEATIHICLRDTEADAEHASRLEAAGFTADPDVLDTWFSSALWPHSTLGWPDPETAPMDTGQTPLGGREGTADYLETYYPGSCLVTARDIITLWVARMVFTGLYNLGDLPFDNVFVHANILDGKGERMSKSKGNGIDPVDIIDRYGTDALRYVLCQLQTGTQDIRLPVQAISPYSGESIDLATAKHGRSLFTFLCPKTGKEFDVMGAVPDVPQAKLVSERFEVGVHFCNKLWNAARFALMNLEGYTFSPLKSEDLAPEDRWILSRLSHAAEETNLQLERYNPSEALGAARKFFWADFCDWYIEIIKSRLADPKTAPVARQVLAASLDGVLRLLHPFIPFITEALWERLNGIAPKRGVDTPLDCPALLIGAKWPVPDPSKSDSALEEHFAKVQEVVRAVRNIRAKHNVPPKRRLKAFLRAEAGEEADLRPYRRMIEEQATLESLDFSADAQLTADMAVAVVGSVEVLVAGTVDVEQERKRLLKQREALMKRIEGFRKKLANEQFVKKAKPEVVERERANLAESEQKLEKMEANLKDLPDA